MKEQKRGLSARRRCFRVGALPEISRAAMHVRCAALQSFKGAM
jgi:hypothetical protein